MFGLKWNKYDFQPLEVVGRGSETQPQVVENLINLLSRIRVNIISESI